MTALEPSVLITTRPQGVAPRTVPIADFDHRVAKHIRDLGGRATLLYTRRMPSEAEREWLDDAGLSWQPWVTGRQPAARDLGRLVGLLRLLQPTVACFQFSAVSWGLVASRLAAVRHRLAWYQTAYEAILQSHRTPPWKRRMQMAIARRYRRLATHHLAVSRSAAEELSRLFKAPVEKTFVCHQGVPLPQLPSSTSRHPATVVCVAGLGPMKGQDTLLEAVARLDRKDVEVVLIGPGDQGPFRRLAESLSLGERCRFTGPLSRQEVYEHFATCTIAVLPTRADAAPKVALEAMACGAPFIGSAVGGLFDFVEPNTSGILVPPADIESWSQALGSLLDDAPRRQALGEAGRLRAACFMLEERGRRVGEALWRLATEHRFEGAVAPLPE